MRYMSYLRSEEPGRDAGCAALRTSRISSTRILFTRGCRFVCSPATALEYAGGRGIYSN